MLPLRLHDLHTHLGAVFRDVNGLEVVDRYGEVGAVEGEYRALSATVGVVDLSFRTRLVLLGADRQRMLNGQVTNNVKDLRPGRGCYAALVNAKARMLADLFIHALQDELLLDAEPGLGASIRERLERFVIAEDVQFADAAEHYGHLGIQGPKSAQLLEKLGLVGRIPDEPLASVAVQDSTLGACYLMNVPRTGSTGFDLFVPNAALAAAFDRLLGAARDVRGRACGWQALETVRIEAGIPRYGADMDEANLPPETGIEAHAISYTKGCYSGQEVIARIRTYGQVARALRGLRLSGDVVEPPGRGVKLFRDGKEVGHVTSSVRSPTLGCVIALGYVRRECNSPGVDLALGSPEATARATVVPLPFAGRLLA